MSAPWAAVVVLSLGLVVLLLWFRRLAPPKRSELSAVRESTRALSEEVGRLSQLLSTQLSILVDQVGKQLSSTAELLQRQEGTLGQRLSGVSEVVADVREKMGAMEEASRRVTALAQDIASLEDILRAPKARGAFGEWLLSDLLSEVLPKDRFCLQYAFKGGETVDAAIFLEGMVVPVDAKFPLEGFQRLLAAASPEERKRQKRALVRDTKKHVDTISRKYIRPDEGTADFALMYIPAEGVYFELTGKEGDSDDLLTYSWSQRVVPCSPNTFYAYLQSVAMGLRGLALAQNVREVLGELRGLEDVLGGMESEFSVLGNHLRNAHNKYEDVEKILGEVQGRIARLAASSEGAGGKGATPKG